MTRNCGFLLAASLCGCAAASGTGPAAQSEHASTTICRIKEFKEDYLGEPVRLGAHIVTDQRHFSYL